MGYALNTTDDYHLHGLTSLGWELTLCNALFPKNSPCRGALLRDASFGEHLFHFLDKNIPLKRVKTVLEVGGGMGYLMRDLLTLAPHLQTTMADISPFLLQRQKESLAGFSVSFLETDFFKMPLPDLRAFDLVILNEVLGDFPTLAADERTVAFSRPGSRPPFGQNRGFRNNLRPALRSCRKHQYRGVGGRGKALPGRRSLHLFERTQL